MGYHNRPIHESPARGLTNPLLLVQGTEADICNQQLSLIVEVVYGPFIWFIKLSLFVLYLEIFGLLKWLRYSAYAGMVVTGIFYLVSLILFSVMCAPRDGQSQFSYLSALASPRCTQSRGLVLAQGVVNIVSDLYLIILPLPAIWSLQMPLKRKLGVAAMICTGIVYVVFFSSILIVQLNIHSACIASILGLVYRVQLIRSDDNTWQVIPVWTTS